MKRKDIYTIVILLIITALTAVFSTAYGSLKYVAIIILVLSGIKFLLVAFQFMELKKAHILWKSLLLGLLVVFIGIVSIIL